MPLHLIKLAVGIDDPDHLAARQQRNRNRAGNFQHRTRMMPARAAEICAGGSMYWVVRGMVQVRQRVVALHRKTDDNARSYCLIELDPALIAVEPVGKRAFQGWRYLRPDDAPRDLAGRGDAFVDPQMPRELKLELRRLGLL